MLHTEKRGAVLQRYERHQGSEASHACRSDVHDGKQISAAAAL